MEAVGEMPIRDAGGVTQHDPLSSTHDACSRVLQVREETKINQRNRKVNNSRSWESGLSHPTSASLMSFKHQQLLFTPKLILMKVLSHPALTYAALHAGV